MKLHMMFIFKILAAFIIGYAFYAAGYFIGGLQDAVLFGVLAFSIALTFNMVLMVRHVGHCCSTSTH